MTHLTKSICLYTATGLLLLTGCNPEKSKKSQQVPASSQKNTPATETPVAKETTLSEPVLFFKAESQDPAWNLELRENAIRFTSDIEGYEELLIARPEMVQAADANVKRYRAFTKEAEIKATIAQGDCANDMPGTTQTYRVRLEIRKNGENDLQPLEGCGTYFTDYRLHDTWVLEQIGGSPLEETGRKAQLPNMEINTKNNKFSGFTGCNQMSGGIFWEPGRLRFIKAITTRRACPPGNPEEPFMTALIKTTTYKIENNRLWLSNPDETLLVFRKTD